LLQNLMKLFPESIDNMIELGIFDGGSIALYEQLLSPARFVGVDIDRERVGALDQYLERHSATERVKLYYGTDQGDRQALKKIIRDNFQGQPLDLVIDDCSHRYEPCKASLNTLLPLLRPGGVYLIEDWAWAHLPSKYFESFGGEKHPLSKLIFECVLVSATHSQIISEVIINNYQVALVRGKRVIRDEHFDISETYLTRWRLNFAPKLSAEALWKTWVPLPVRKQVSSARRQLQQLLP
jgi:Methyltransferase domain